MLFCLTLIARAISKYAPRMFGWLSRQLTPLPLCWADAASRDEFVNAVTGISQGLMAKTSDNWS